jgi:hypothetical protein
MIEKLIEQEHMAHPDQQVLKEFIEYKIYLESLE